MNKRRPGIRRALLFSCALDRFVRLRKWFGRRSGDRISRRRRGNRHRAPHWEELRSTAIVSTRSLGTADHPEKASRSRRLPQCNGGMLCLESRSVLHQTLRLGPPGARCSLSQWASKTDWIDTSRFETLYPGRAADGDYRDAPSSLIRRYS